MQTRRINEALIGIMALGKAAELGRQLVLVTDSKFAEKQAQRNGAAAPTLQAWGNGYIGFDAIISITGILGMVQGMRKNRKGAGQAALLQGGTILAYSLYYLLYTLVGLKKAKSQSRIINLGASIAHGAAGFAIYRFARRALA